MVFGDSNLLEITTHYITKKKKLQLEDLMH